MAAITDPSTEASPASPTACAGEAATHGAGRDRLIQQVERLLRESGNSEPFEAAAWVELWLQRPNHALGGAAPELDLNTPEGEALLSSLIGAMAAGSYL
ncbi:MAG: antitoxin Xre/MbcA/ParS toxin-binding domain-containing protein [Synechococcaceae cyanobacterium]